jgi:hypothetical protein
MNAASISLFLEGEEQPLDLLALHVAFQLIFDLGAAEETDLFASKIFWSGDSHGLVHQKPLVIEDRPRETQAGVGRSIYEIGRGCREQCNFTGLEGLQCILFIAVRRAVFTGGAPGYHLSVGGTVRGDTELSIVITGGCEPGF